MRLVLASAILSIITSAAAQAGPWAQCGGIGHTGPTTCVSGHYCNELNPWYSQCIPGQGSNPPPPPPPPPPPIPTTPTPPPPPPPPPPPGTTTAPGPPPTTTNPAPPPAGSCPALPNALGAATSQLPDPFTFRNGARVQTRADWVCRQREMLHQLQQYELGTLPAAPTVSASFSGSSLSIQVSNGGSSISFSVSISGAGTASAPRPAIIAYGFASIPVPAGVATITFNNDDIAAHTNSGSRGQGKFFQLYGSGHSAGAMTAWAWGVGRIIDALERVPAAGIDPTRIGVTGCSRNGKGALVAGALEPRVALTLPQESGSGGSACWRISDWQRRVQNRNVQTASQIITENVWLGPAFNTHVNNVNSLPFDHHQLAGLIAPRPLYVMENADMEWLGATSTYGCMQAARKQWEALGALDNFGYSQVGGNQHCSFPSAKQGGELSAFINKFLLRSGSGTTNIFRTEASHPSYNQAEWSPWTVPNLA